MNLALTIPLSVTPQNQKDTIRQQSNSRDDKIHRNLDVDQTKPHSNTQDTTKIMTTINNSNSNNKIENDISGWNLSLRNGTHRNDLENYERK